MSNVDIFDAQISMILNKKSSNNLKKGKNEIFDDFILDLFSN